MGLYTEGLIHGGAYTRRGLYTEGLIHGGAYTRRGLYTGIRCCLQSGGLIHGGCNKFLPVLLWNLFDEKREIRSIYCRTLTAFIDCILPE